MTGFISYRFSRLSNVNPFFFFDSSSFSSESESCINWATFFTGYTATVDFHSIYFLRSSSKFIFITSLTRSAFWLFLEIPCIGTGASSSDEESPNLAAYGFLTVSFCMTTFGG